MLREKAPELLADLPEGYCAHCDVCGEPGHMRHFPGAMPYTGGWCDAHYLRARFFHPLSPVGCLFWLLVVGGSGLALARWLLQH